MKSQTIIAGVVGVLLLLAAGAFAYSQTSMTAKKTSVSDTQMTKDTTQDTGSGEMMPKTDSPAKQENMMQKNVGESRYELFSSAALQDANKGRRVLFFYASWCPTCKAADSSFNTNVAQIPSDVTLLRVNYNDPDTDEIEKELAKQYAITYQHTFVQIDSSGKELTKWNGGQIEELLSNLK